MEKLRFLTPDKAREARDAFGTPAYIYDEATLTAQAQAALNFPNAFGLTVRYAMKASPNAAILQLFQKLGLPHRRELSLRSRACTPRRFLPGKDCA